MNYPEIGETTAIRSEHLVQFYENDTALLESVDAFVFSALAAGDAVILVATQEHLAGLERQWRAQGFDVEAARASGQYVALDAATTLDAILVGGWPDAARFDTLFAPLFESALRRHPRVVAFGEMVALLWSEGNLGAAVHLESLWNALQRRHRFDLLCAYPIVDMGSVGQEALEQVCSVHTSAMPAGEQRASSGLDVGVRESASSRLYEELAQRKAIERALAAREKELSDLLENAALGVHSVAADGTIQWANRYELAMLGYAADEFIGHSILEFHADRDEGQAILTRLHSGETLRDEPTRLRCRDGTIRDVVITSNVQWDGVQFVRARCFVRDTTEEKRAQRALARVEHSVNETRALLAAIVASSDDAIVSKSLDGRITSWNEGARRIFGYSEAEALGSPITLIIPPELHVEERAILGKLARGERIDHFETVRVAKDGRRVYVSLTISPVRDAAGRVVGASKIARDITERKRLEERLRDADRRKNEFLAMLGHELRNPLASIRNITEVLVRTTDLNASHRELCAMLGRQVNHITRLLDDLLDMSRIVQGKIKFERRPVVIADVVRQAVETARPFIDAQSHRLDIHLPDESLIVRGDAARLVQMLGNLLNNAAKYTPPGGDLRVAVQRSGQSVQIAVSDNGAGISPDRQSKIFELFYQDDRTLEHSHNGLGIGLTLVRSIVEHHDGTVTVHSPGVGLGSEFVVTLPIGEEVHATPASPSDGRFGDQPAPDRKRILIVDDNCDASTSLAILLRMKGHDVAVAADGPSALEIVGQSPPDLALLDIGLPGMDGYEIARRLRERGFTKRLVAVTGYGAAEDRERSRLAGFDDHFVKPIDPTQLEQFIALAPNARSTAAVGSSSLS